MALFSDIKVDYVDHMGSDLTVVNSARVSFNKSKDVMDDKDDRLINYLASHGHWTPFSHAMITLRETVPVFCARQRFKHMIGFTYNEVSRRYVDDDPEFYSPDLWRTRPEGSVKQGSGEIHCDTQLLSEEYKELIESVSSMYKSWIDDGVAPEQARMILPQSMMTSYHVTGSLYAFARAYNQRIDGHAQKEIQDLAVKWGDIIEPLFPVSWKALTLNEE